jgi:hypothetical protein
MNLSSLTKKPPDPHKPTITKPSFRDKLLGSAQEIPIHEKEDMIEKYLSELS